MKSYEEITKNELRDLLNAGWITHDAMWLANSVKKYGMKETNAINKSTVRMMAIIEAKRLKKIMDTGDPQTFGELKEFLLTSFEIIRGSFMNFGLEFREPHTITWNAQQCFAYDGIKRIGVLDNYDCGIIERVLGWFDELKISYEMKPLFTGCLKHSTGQCVIEFNVRFS